VSNGTGDIWSRGENATPAQRGPRAWELGEGKAQSCDNNSSEKRLARILLLLAHFGKESKPETVIPKISQEVLAEMIGTTRSRVSFFMNRFRKLGFVDYDETSLQVQGSLLNIVLHD
jgi:hypothetical protein